MTISPRLLNVVRSDELPPRAASALNSDALLAARQILTTIEQEGPTAVRRLAERWDGLAPDESLWLDRAEISRRAAVASADDRAVLERAAARITRFAAAQRAALRDVDVPVPGGRAGHTVQPLGVAGCYAPGGRYPLVSSLLMTACTARAAGVARIFVATPRPNALLCAAAEIAGVDGLLAAGGAQAIVALALGVGVPEAVDVIAGPGNHWVTAAKYCVSDRVRIDMLAGPSELAVVADETAAAAVVAADLLAQAEHDVAARPILLALDATVVERVEGHLQRQLATLPTADTARAALQNSMAVVLDSRAQALTCIRRLAPEHLELHIHDAAAFARHVRNCGCIFIGGLSAEVFGDYGIGPNHTLPTSGSARHTSGLSVATFLRMQMWLALDEPSGAEGVMQDSVRLAQLEGLAAHARAGTARLR